METLNRQEADTVVSRVKGKYAAIAAESGSCCGPAGCGPKEQEAITLDVGYTESQLKKLPQGANLGLGCGAPIDHLALQTGETVLDLGSGAGIDVFLAADIVGPQGQAIGVDMTPQMIERAKRNAQKVGAQNVEFREGRLENLPVASASVDAVTSNCVINLVPDKAAVFQEVSRVLKPGGRLVISDIVLERPLPKEIEEDLYAYVGCISGAALREPYFGWLEAAGLGHVEILKDVDYGAMIIDHEPKEAERLAKKAGVSIDSLRGSVRSLTYRATKQATKQAAKQACCGPTCCS